MPVCRPPMPTEPAGTRARRGTSRRRESGVHSAEIRKARQEADQVHAIVRARVATHHFLRRQTSVGCHVLEVRAKFATVAHRDLDFIAGWCIVIGKMLERRGHVTPHHFVGRQLGTVAPVEPGWIVMDRHGREAGYHFGGTGNRRGLQRANHVLHLPPGGFADPRSRVDDECGVAEGTRSRRSGILSRTATGTVAAARRIDRRRASAPRARDAESAPIPIGSSAEQNGL